MMREEREQFIRNQIFSEGTWEDAVQAIADRWEDDIAENRSDAAFAQSVSDSYYR